MTIKEAQKQVDQWINTFGVRYFNELTNTAILMEETGELARLMSRVYGEQSFKNKSDEENAGALIKEEIADILWVIICLANQMDIDLDMAFQQSMIKKTNRDRNRHKNNPSLE